LLFAAFRFASGLLKVLKTGSLSLPVRLSNFTTSYLSIAISSHLHAASTRLSNGCSTVVAWLELLN
jgi:hypothetical protein